jgi:hypothetical protein
VEGPFSDLADVLRREAARYRELVRLGGEQQEILVSGRMEALAENVKRQEKEMFALGPLAEERRAAFESAARRLRLSRPTLSEIADKCPSGEAGILRAALAEMSEVAKALEGSNRGNGKLLENALGYVTFTLEALKGGGKGRMPGLRPEVPKAPSGGTRFNQQA